ncbi:MAG: CHRD domain-containing protein [Planctomycetota bacterium]|nr:CHRD domain-containing protein [Planctomycetota bacterium]
MAETQLRPYQDRLDSCPSRVAMHDWWLRLTTTDPRLHVGVGRITKKGRDLFTFFIVVQRGCHYEAGSCTFGVALAEAAMYSSLQAGTAYLNVHSSTFPGGEIRGFLNAVPEPASLTSLAIGAVGLLLARRRFVKRK